MQKPNVRSKESHGRAAKYYSEGAKYYPTEEKGRPAAAANNRQLGAHPRLEPEAKQPE